MQAVVTLGRFLFAHALGLNLPVTHAEQVEMWKNLVYATRDRFEDAFFFLQTHRAANEA